jgi:hypothetical protein
MKRMSEAEQISDLIGDIYDAALNAELWKVVLPKCAQFVGGSAAALFSKDAVNKTGNAVYYCGIDPYFERLYFEKIVKLDPLTVGHYFADVGEPVAVTDIMPYEEFLETRAYQEWGRPQGIVDTLNVALEKTATSAAFFAIFPARALWIGRRGDAPAHAAYRSAFAPRGADWQGHRPENSRSCIVLRYSRWS